VSGIIQLGGTMLQSARSDEFRTEAGRRQAIAHLERRGIDALVVIGGNGSQAGAHELSKLGVHVMGVASTIDNDLVGTEVTIGFDTALNIALEAIDRIKVTASSHRRAFLVEVMGRDCGMLALMAGIAGGAEVVVIPEMELSADDVIESLRLAHMRGKPHAIAVVSEGAKHNAAALTNHVKGREKEVGFALRATTLGHVQRGGAPLASDRLLATRLGAGVIEALREGAHGMLIGWMRGAVERSPLSEIAGRKRTLDPYLFQLARVLDR
jgi:6-phosphofructokinase 1